MPFPILGGWLLAPSQSGAVRPNHSLTHRIKHKYRTNIKDNEREEIRARPELKYTPRCPVAPRAPPHRAQTCRQYKGTNHLTGMGGVSGGGVTRTKQTIIKVTLIL
ncbi:hypothetical protein XENTR_v10003199 [Xenopus tropicalis]|uniref:Uncharacterized protein n=1 Tax=Xenopus tropicalis TaxID=8364 RepID=A0A1B8Y4V8_XENTR|nr:hypothetical protein XENTR_v10003199 [Xenopus tropicalis]